MAAGLESGAGAGSASALGSGAGSGSASDRALAALYGLAIGDALGMPTQLLSPAEIKARFGVLDRFHPAAEDHPIAAGMAAGSVTDDTEQAILLAEALIAGDGHVDAAGFAQALVEWEERMRAKGSLDLLGPSTKAAVAAILAGTPVEEAGRYGTTNGAAMRVTPVGIVMPLSGLGTHDGVAGVGAGAALGASEAGGTGKALDALVDRVVEASSPTHNTSVAIAGAAAVAAAVSAGIDGATVAEATSIAIRAAQLGAERGNWSAEADVARRIELAVALASGPASPARASRRQSTNPSAGLRTSPPTDLSTRSAAGSVTVPAGEPSAGAAAELSARLADIRDLIGTSLATQEAVPAAFGVLAIFPDDPWAACLAAASLGGDSDTIAAMAGAIAGACHGMGGFPQDAIDIIRSVNGLPLEALAQSLMELRAREAKA